MRRCSCSQGEQSERIEGEWGRDGVGRCTPYVIRQSLQIRMSHIDCHDVYAATIIERAATYLNDFGISRPKSSRVFNDVAQLCAHTFDSRVLQQPESSIFDRLRIIETRIQVDEISFWIRETFGASGQVAELLQAQFTRFSWQLECAGL